MPSYPKSASQLLGQTVDNGVLEIKAILGAGSFGVVYRAVDTRTGVEYAVKCVEKKGKESREEKLHACVSSHPHVLTLHRQFDEGRFSFFVYDLCAGDLHSVTRKAAFFREDELIKRVFTQIIDALEHCHKRGVYHRDLKPENILVSAKSGDIDVFVADFGLATASKRTESSCGTSCFMSPGMFSPAFQFRSFTPISESLVPHHERYSNAEADIWALGCILAEMIGNIRVWYEATPEDEDYSDYLRDRTVLFEMLPISEPAYLLLRKILSTQPRHRPSLATIRAQVLAIDRFFITDEEAENCGWTERLEMMPILRERGDAPLASRRSSETSSGSVETYSSSSCYSTGSSSSAFNSSSAESSDVPATPPTPAVEAVPSMDKASLVVLASRAGPGQRQTC